ncbi:dipeptidase [Alicyclobacillus sp. ALC3]|uniref:dipeptidase n=1 Tax=Alicyclobacillus sp. ALC3 TaxID=2796143 RepID=UPI002379F5F9|nr:membrane dipeptidase [Alicyclobacillus sp. ALC3]WDL95368.1 membrane dipeptidase [Alicyclobacillus sp. ALC3]
MYRAPSGHIVFDLHSDIPADIALWRAKGEKAVFATRHADRLAASGVRAAVFALWVEPQYRNAAATRLTQLAGALLADLGESPERVQLVRTAEELDACLSSGRFAVMLGVEGMTFVEQWPADIRLTAQMEDRAAEGHAAILDEQARQSLRLLSGVGLREAILVWGERNAIASGPVPTAQVEDESGGLTDFGGRVVRLCEDLGVVIDLSHLNEASTNDVLAVAKGTVIASHSNARALCDHPRNLRDEHIKEVGRRGGVVGINSYARFVHPDRATLDRYIDHIVYVAELTGIDHVGLGFDFMDYLPDDLGFPERTEGLARVEDIPQLLQRLSERGLTDEEIAKVSWQNAARVMGVVRTKQEVGSTC